MNAQNTVIAEGIENRVRIIEAALLGRGEEVRLHYDEIWKNNVKKPAIIVQRKDSNVSPTIYITPDMEGWTDDQYAERITSILRRSEEDMEDLDVNKYLTKDYILEHIRPKIISNSKINIIAARNNEYIYMESERLGLILMYFIEIQEQSKEGMASITLTEKIRDMAGVSTDKIKEAAFRNINSITTINTMREVMLSIMNIPAEIADDIIPEDDIPMWVVTTKDKYFGAATIMSQDTINRIAEVIGSEDFFILPSSVHEVLVIPAGKDMDPEELLAMVKQVNETEVSVEDRLADAVYKVKDGVIDRELVVV